MMYMPFQHHAYLVPYRCFASSSSFAHLHSRLHRDLATHPHHHQYRSCSLCSEPDPLDGTPESAQAPLDDSFSVVDSVLGSDYDHVESPHHYHQTRVYYHPISNSHFHSRPQWSSLDIESRWYLISAVPYLVVRKDHH